MKKVRFLPLKKTHTLQLSKEMQQKRLKDYPSQGKVLELMNETKK